MPRPTLSSFALAVALVPLHAQQAPSPASRPQSGPASSPTSQPGGDTKLRWPRDKARVIATVGGRDLTLADLLRHVDERHAPGFMKAAAAPHGESLLRSPVAAAWVRQFADVVALEAEAAERGLAADRREAALAESLKRGFERWLATYDEQRHRSGRHEPLSEAAVNQLLAKYQTEFGLETEVLGWLDALVRDDMTEQELYEYYASHGPLLGGVVSFAHILVYHRDPYTGELLDAEARQRAWEKVADIRSRLKPDGSNFEEIAAMLSDDRRTASRGGVFTDVSRFDTRLPGILPRTAWQLADDEWTGPVESPYGLHFIKRRSFEMRTFFLFTSEEAREKVRGIMRQHRMEDLLFDVRAKRDVRLHY